MLSVGMLIGAGFKFAQMQVHGKKLPIPLIIFAIIAGLGLFFSAVYFGSRLTSVSLFVNFSSVFEGVSYEIIKYNAQLVSVILLISIFEIGLGSGFGVAYKVGMIKESKAHWISSEAEGAPNDLGTTDGENVNNFGSSTGVTAAMTDFKTTAVKDLDTNGIAEEQGLRRDEQSMMELFLYGKVSQITPVVNVTRPEGYSYEGIPQLDWETKRSRQALDALVRKGFLNAELVDKVIVCIACGSANVRIRKVCPECNSLRLRKEGLLEHFSCGAVERQSMFEAENGDLVCPKCKAKLNLIGSDYRVLPPAYMCLGCNTLQSEPLLTTKCGDCGSTAEIDEEPEIFLYKYSANSELPLQEFQQIKPLETCAKFFKSLGYSIVAPAFVSGRSGTQHMFDMLILGRVGWVETNSLATSNAFSRSDNGNTVVEVLISSKPVELEEITRIYGKISDVDCDFLLFVMPGLTAEARNYAAAYNMKVSEGRNIEEALANSKIPKISGSGE